MATSRQASGFPVYGTRLLGKQGDGNRPEKLRWEEGHCFKPKPEGTSVAHGALTCGMTPESEQADGEAGT